MSANEAISARAERWRARRVVTMVVLAGALAAEAFTFGYFLHHLDVEHHSLWLVTIATPLFGLAVLALARSGLPDRVAGWLVLGTGALFQLIALSQQPLTSDDDYRYIWDGRVQLAGIDPYRYAPSAPQLDRLHDTLLYATPGHCGHLIVGGCTAINRPDVHTVYPPVAQALFVVVRLLSFGGHGGRLPFQLAAAAGATAITVLLLRRAHRLGRPTWLVGLWAWCPVTISEFGNNAHIDWLAVILTVLALQASAQRRAATSGALLGAAVATKLYPAVVAVSMLRRRPMRLLTCAAAVIALGYVPHVAAVGTKVIGFLPGYLHQEGYSSGSRLLLLGTVFPGGLAVVVGIVAALAVAAWAYRHTDPDRPELTAVVLAGAALLIATPNYGWYAALLISLSVMSERWEWLPIALAPTFTYLYRGEWLHTGLPSSAIYAIAALLSAALMLLHRRVDTGRSAGQTFAEAGNHADQSPSGLVV